jgi:hypothetical protein
MVVTSQASLVSRLKCQGCLSLGPVAGKSTCRYECNRLNIFPETCAKVCSWMIANHPETACRIAQLCTLETLDALKNGGVTGFGFDEDEDGSNGAPTIFNTQDDRRFWREGNIQKIWNHEEDDEDQLGWRDVDPYIRVGVKWTF